MLWCAYWFVSVTATQEGHSLYCPYICSIYCPPLIRTSLYRVPCPATFQPPPPGGHALIEYYWLAFGNYMVMMVFSCDNTLNAPSQRSKSRPIITRILHEGGGGWSGGWWLYVTHKPQSRTRCYRTASRVTRNVRHRVIGRELNRGCRHISVRTSDQVNSYAVISHHWQSSLNKWNRLELFWASFFVFYCFLLFFYAIKFEEKFFYSFSHSVFFFTKRSEN